MATNDEALDKTTVDRAKEDLRTLCGTDIVYCSRVWEAWQHGTMGQDDFALVADDEQILDDILTTVREAITDDIRARVVNEVRNEVARLSAAQGNGFGRLAAATEDLRLGSEEALDDVEKFLKTLI